MALSDIPQHTLDATLATAGTKATYTGAGTFTVGWLLSSEVGILVGIVIGFVGLVMQFHYSRKRDRRESAEHALRMDELRAEIAREAEEKLIAAARVASEKVNGR